MFNAGRHTMFKPKPYPWDYRIEYIHCTDYRNHFFFVYPLEEGGTPEELSVVANTDSKQTGDKKFLGSTCRFGLACYGGGWRHSGYDAWDSGGGQISASHLKFRWTVSLDGATLSDPDTEETLWTGAGAASPTADHYGSWSPPQNHLYSSRPGNSASMSFDKTMFCALGLGSWFGDNFMVESVDNIFFEPLSTWYTPYKIYDFYHKVNGAVTAHLIPCVMGGVVGMYDEVGKRFYSSLNASYQFSAGPQIKDSEGYSVP